MVLFLGIGLFGVLVCIASLYAHQFWGCVVGGVIFGAAHGNVVVAMRAVLSRYFAENEVRAQQACEENI